MTRKKINKIVPDKKNKGVGYVSYPVKDDIYNREKEEEDLDPENPAKPKAPNEKQRILNEKNFEDDVSGDDLDIPGTELDDEMERIGSEDEENNHYSRGDNHLETADED
jgi:hypothetical protein